MHSKRGLQQLNRSFLLFLFLATSRNCHWNTVPSDCMISKWMTDLNNPFIISVTDIMHDVVCKKNIFQTSMKYLPLYPIITFMKPVAHVWPY